MLHIYSYIARMYYFCQLKLWPIKWQLLNLYTYWSTHYPRRYLTMPIRTPRLTEAPETFGSLLLESLPLWGSAAGRGPPRKRTWDPRTPILCRGCRAEKEILALQEGVAESLTDALELAWPLGTVPKKGKEAKRMSLLLSSLSAALQMFKKLAKMSLKYLWSNLVLWLLLRRHCVPVLAPYSRMEPSGPLALSGHWSVGILRQVAGVPSWIQ